mmetsp:Transcript_42437/g.105672  ORF Transcript_42437/g.105672 Transcript_42437/m.105672 type:complete len:202 (+) Transcript_42437:132-737(+)
MRDGLTHRHAALKYSSPDRSSGRPVCFSDRSNSEPRGPEQQSELPSLARHRRQRLRWRPAAALAHPLSSHPSPSPAQPNKDCSQVRHGGVGDASGIGGGGGDGVARLWARACTAWTTGSRVVGTAATALAWLSSISSSASKRASSRVSIDTTLSSAGAIAASFSPTSRSASQKTATLDRCMATARSACPITCAASSLPLPA